MSLGYLWFRLSYRENSFPFTTGISFPTTVEPTVFAGRCFVSCNFYAGNKKFIYVFERRTSCVLSVQVGRVSIFFGKSVFLFFKLTIFNPFTLYCHCSEVDPNCLRGIHSWTKTVSAMIKARAKRDCRLQESRYPRSELSLLPSDANSCYFHFGYLSIREISSPTARFLYITLVFSNALPVL